jgi:hypothetical protein
MFSTSKFFRAGGGGGGSGYIAIGSYNSPYISAYPWASVSGFGTKYANPSTLTTNYIISEKFNLAGDAIAVSSPAFPYIYVWRWSGSGFGSRYSDPGTAATGGAQGMSVAFNPAGTALALAQAYGTSPYILVYNWSASGFGSKYGDPSTLPTGWCKMVKFNPAGNAIATAYDNFPYISAYPWSVSGFGTKYTDPSPQLSATSPYMMALDFNPAGTAVAISGYGYPGVQVHAWSGSGFGTKYTDPTTPPSTGGGAVAYDVAFNPAGNSIAALGSAAPFIFAYPWSNATGFGTKYANPVGSDISTTYSQHGLSFNSTGSDIAMAMYNSPYVTAYSFSASGFGTKYAAPVGILTNSTSLTFSS